MLCSVYFNCRPSIVCQASLKLSGGLIIGHFQLRLGWLVPDLTLGLADSAVVKIASELEAADALSLGDLWWTDAFQYRLGEQLHRHRLEKCLLVD